MDTGAKPTDLLSRPTATQVREALRTVLADTTFQNSERLSRFLRFVVERTLAGEAEPAEGVSDRRAGLWPSSSYDPRLDPVVRLEARRLRARLQAYYQAEGQRDPLRIEVPKGGYAPRFVAATPLPAALCKDVARPADRPYGRVRHIFHTVGELFRSQHACDQYG